MPDDPRDAIQRGLGAIGTAYRDAFRAATTESGLRVEAAKVLGKKGELPKLLALMRDLEPAARAEMGALVNTFKRDVEQAFEARLAELGAAARQAELGGRPFDLTLPGRVALGRGHAHPLLQVRDELLDIFRDLGFEVVDGPEVELEDNNFAKLAFPPDHPATDMQATFWVDVHDACSESAGRTEAARALLRTHTSNVQVRQMIGRRPPLAVVSAGTVYRPDEDLTHSPMFHQIEGFVVDEAVSFAHLKAVLTAFAEGLYGQGTAVRWRPSYFPFVEPGAELDVGCVMCAAPDGTRRGCRVCKGTGWLEVLGCGMIHPLVLEQCGIDSERFTGYAFGMGIERTAMLRYAIPNIRLLFDNDPRFLSQF